MWPAKIRRVCRELGSLHFWYLLDFDINTIPWPIPHVWSEVALTYKPYLIQNSLPLFTSTTFYAHSTALLRMSNFTQQG